MRGLFVLHTDLVLLEWVLVEIVKSAVGIKDVMPVAGHAETGRFGNDPVAFFKWIITAAETWK